MLSMVSGAKAPCELDHLAAQPFMSTLPTWFCEINATSMHPLRLRIDRVWPKRYCFGRRQISGMPPFRPENARNGFVARIISSRRNKNV
jgi:hypothetical protein